jgi:hypothetical protein
VRETLLGHNPGTSNACSSIRVLGGAEGLQRSANATCLKNDRRPNFLVVRSAHFVSASVSMSAMIRDSLE